MKRILPLALLLGAVAARAADSAYLPDQKLRAEKQELKAAGVAALGAVLPFVPPKWALDTLAPQTFSKWPYRRDGGYVNAADRSFAYQASGSAQAVVNGGLAVHALGHLRTESRLGVDFSWSGYDSRALGTVLRADYMTGHVTTSLLEREDLLFETGLGAASLQREQSKSGASWVFNLELYRGKPWILSARYCPAILFDGRFYHDLRAEAGAALGPIALTIGGRAFLNPLRNALGPEASLKAWF